jgi:hypothetical protein
MNKNNAVRIKDSLANLDTKQMEIICLFDNGGISSYDILWPVTSY